MVSQVNYYLTNQSQIAAANKLFTNLPKPAEDIYITLSGGYCGSLTKNSTELKTVSAIPASTNLIGGFSYPVE